jgi:hypothetical protein
MTGRRSHPRFTVATPWNGTMRVLRDVVVDRTGRDELLAVSQAPAIVGEDMSLDLLGRGQILELRVKVIDSRPVIIDGSVRHRIRLELLSVHVGTLVPEASDIDVSERPAPRTITGPVAEAV